MVNIMGKIESDVLRMRQSLPLDLKIQMSKRRIQEWYEYWDGKVYVAFSGGKDSTVLLHLVRSMYPDVPGVFVDTGLEYPEIRDFVKTIENIVWIKPERSFKEVIETQGYPVISKECSQAIYELRNYNLSEKWKDHYLKRKISNKWKYLLDSDFKISHMCCRIMKKKPFKIFNKQSNRKTFVGTMAQDSFQRQSNYLKNSCNNYTNEQSTPFGFWLERDIWTHIKSNNISYCKIYDMGWDRTGCMFCMFGVHLENYPNRFQRMKHTHPQLWKYCMFKLGLKDVLEYVNVPWKDENRKLDEWID